MYVTAFNTSSGPVTVDAEGRQIGSRDWGTANTTADQASAAFDAGWLVKVDNIDDGAHPEAVAARDRTAIVSDRADRLSELDKDVLARVALDAGVPGADTATKPELVAALAARPAVDIPPARPADVQEQQPDAEVPAPESPRKATQRRREGQE